MSFSGFSDSLLRYPDLGLSLDCSLMDLPASYLTEIEPQIARALKDLSALEAGEIANPDEQRMVGHYWLRNPALAPNDELRTAITDPLEKLRAFAAAVHDGTVTPPGGGRFTQLLVIGIGGSALGPQFIYDALEGEARMKTFFFDNTDPAGIDHTLSRVGDLGSTLALVISKSGGTPETRNGMLEAKAAYEAAGLDFGAHAVAITGEGSKLDQFATEHDWITRFPMEDWVGGRTSIMSTVGLVPMALQGFDVEAFLAGAATMDTHTRATEYARNASLQLAVNWHHEGNGKGEKDMVVLPYKDSLVLFSKYLQQLIMESLGKRLDLEGNEVHQGIAVYGNKGSTDQHAYVQQLRDGVHNFFATFIEVRQGREGASIEVDPGVTSGDYLQGFLRGTRKALYQSGRRSITLSIEEVDATALGALVALFERAVSFYASLVNINAYHQPGVEAGKKAAATFLDLLSRVKGALTSESRDAESVAQSLGAEAEDVYHCLVHLSANGGAVASPGASPAEDRFTAP